MISIYRKLCPPFNVPFNCNSVLLQDNFNHFFTMFVNKNKVDYKGEREIVNLSVKLVAYCLYLGLCLRKFVT